MDSICFCLNMSSDVPHPKTGLTPKVIKKVRESWQAVRPDIREVGAATLTDFFKQPQHQETFGIKLEESVTRVQITKVVFSLGALVSALDDAEVFVILCARLGTKYRRLSPSMESVNDFKGSFLGQMELLLGKKRFPLKTRQAWITVLDTIIHFMQFEEAQ
jgi:hypothetical protein